MTHYIFFLNLHAISLIFQLNLIFKYCFNRCFLFNTCINSLVQVHDLEDSNLELKLILDMYKRESTDSGLGNLHEYHSLKIHIHLFPLYLLCISFLGFIFVVV